MSTSSHLRPVHHVCVGVLGLGWGCVSVVALASPVHHVCVGVLGCWGWGGDVSTSLALGKALADF